MWQALIIFYFFFGTVSYLLRRVLAQKLGEENRLINSVLYLLVLLLGGGVIWPVYYIVAFNANKDVDVGIFAVINNVSPVFTLALALPFLHETPTAQQFIGIGLLIASGVLAASSKLHKNNRIGMRGILLCLLTAAVMGVAIAYERFMLTRVDFGAYLIFGWGAQIAWSAILTGNGLRKLPALFAKSSETRRTLITWGAASALRSVTFIVALKLSGASLMSAASDFLSVAVVIAAFFYLNEREHIFYKWFAAAIGVAGLLFIAG